MATYAVGDIQGCYRSLMKLLEKANFDPRKDELWSVGDIINRGKNNLEVIQFCQSLGDRFTASLGNHDLHFLAIALGHHKIRPSDTFQDVLAAKNLEEITDWLRQQKLMHYDKKRQIIMSHAGVPPKWSLKQARARASEVEQVIQDERLSRTYFTNMYGNSPNTWNKDLTGAARWRLITNYFTRMRFCDTDGKLELNCKAEPSRAPKGYMPWFQVPDRKTANYTILFGHWAALLGKTDQNCVIALDTGCVWGEKMTMVDVDKLGAPIKIKSREK